MVKFTLLENALDSVETGLDYFSNALEKQDRRDYKQCLLNLFQAAELLLKAVISMHGVGTVFNQKSLSKHCKDPENPTEAELHRCQSVNIEGICKLLGEYNPNEFPAATLKMISAVAQMRNNLQHFALEISPEDLAMQLSELYRQVFRPAFILLQADEADNAWNSEVRRQYIALEAQFMEISTPDEYTLALCPACESWSHFIVYGGESYPVSSHCICCNFRLQNLQPWDFHRCPECDCPSVVYVPEHRAGACLVYKCYYS